MAHGLAAMAVARSAMARSRDHPVADYSARGLSQTFTYILASACASTPKQGKILAARNV